MCLQSCLSHSCIQQYPKSLGCIAICWNASSIWYWLCHCLITKRLAAPLLALAPFRIRLLLFSLQLPLAALELDLQSHKNCIIFMIHYVYICIYVHHVPSPFFGLLRCIENPVVFNPIVLICCFLNFSLLDRRPWAFPSLPPGLASPAAGEACGPLGTQCVDWCYHVLPNEFNVSFAFSFMKVSCHKGICGMYEYPSVKVLFHMIYH